MKKNTAFSFQVSGFNVKALRAFTSTREEHVQALGLHNVRTPLKQTRRGFTLIETFVATSVLLVSLVGPLSLAAQSLRSAYYARDQVTAFYLAQEAIEYVRAKRDQNYMAGASWLTGLTSGVSCLSVACTVDFKNFTHAVCGGGGCAPLLISASPEFIFNTTLGTPSLFTRTLTILPVANNADEVSLQVTVSWVSAGISRSFHLKENIFNWL